LILLVLAAVGFYFNGWGKIFYSFWLIFD
jgi:hypothetical protein